MLEVRRRGRQRIAVILRDAAASFRVNQEPAARTGVAIARQLELEPRQTPASTCTKT